MPLSGVNPVTRAARFVVPVEELEREEISRRGEDEFLGYPSITPTILLGPESGEPQINVIPASAQVLAAFGARVFCAGLNVASAGETVREVEDQGGEGEALELDMRDTESVRARGPDYRGAGRAGQHAERERAQAAAGDRRRGVRPGGW